MTEKTENTSGHFRATIFQNFYGGVCWESPSTKAYLPFLNLIFGFAPNTFDKFLIKTYFPF